MSNTTRSIEEHEITKGLRVEEIETGRTGTVTSFDPADPSQPKVRFDGERAVEQLHLSNLVTPDEYEEEYAADLAAREADIDAALDREEIEANAAIAREEEAAATGAITLDGEVIGWVHADGCENEKCRRHIAAGRRWHATPRGFAVTIEPNHFEASVEAVGALVDAAKANPEALARSIEITRNIEAGR